MRYLYLTTALGLSFLPFGFSVQAQATNLPRAQTLIFNTNSLKCIDDPYSSLTAGTKIQQYVCHGNKNQFWRLMPAKSGVMIKNNLSGLCLAPVGSSKEAGSEIEFTNCDAKSDNTIWVVNTKNTQVSLTNRNSNLCLAVTDQSLKNEAKLIQANCSSNQDQLWSFANKTADIPSSSNGNGGNGNGGNGQSNNGSGGGKPTPTPTPTPSPTPINKPALSTTGKWTSPFDLGLSATSAAVLANGKVLIWAGFKTKFFGGGSITQIILFDPATNRKSTVLSYSKGDVYQTNTGQEYFCEGLSIMANGSIIVTGGPDAEKTSIATPNGDWSASSNLNIARGYAGSTLTSKGQVFTLGGSWRGGKVRKMGELYTPGSGWKVLKNVSPDDFLTNDTSDQFRSDNHMWLFAAANGWVFHAGPSKNMHWINTSGDGTVVGLGNRGNDGHAMNGNAIMYDINKILTVGGAPNYEDGPPTNNATLIDISAGPGKNVTSHPIAGMQYARKYGHSILLPNGQVVVAGGGGAGTHIFSDVDAVMPAELWDPETEKFRTLPAMSTPRTYHSIGFLMVDGRVMLAGGGLGVDFFIQLSPIHTDAEIYTPPYLLNADGTDATRPVIASAPSTATAGQYITVLSSGATSFTLIRASADTHSLNNDQRRIPLTLDGSSATKVSMTKGNDAVTLKIPDERGIVLPGTYYLFALDERGTPSMGWMMNIQ